MAILALATGDHATIRGSWRISQLALQIIAEQGPGMAVFAEEQLEDAQVAALHRGMSRPHA